MFDWFDKTFRRRNYPTWDDIPPSSDMEKIVNDMSKVIPFPESKSSPPVPHFVPPLDPEKPSITYYRLGLTDNNRVSFQMGYSEITMNAAGIDNLITQLKCFRDMLHEENND